MNRKLLLLLLFPISAFAQGVGNSSFGVTQIPVSGISAALGGSQVSINKGDILQTADNPAFYDSTSNKSASFSYMNYISTINQASAGYAREVEKLGLVSGYLRYFDYGTFTETDEVGNEYGKFKAVDYEIGFSLSRKYTDNISYGFTFKQMFASMYQYSAYGLGADAGVYYQSDNKQFTAGLVLNNVGLKLKDFTNTNNEWLPIESSIAISKKFSKAPIRFGLQYSNLQKWDLAETDADALANTKQDQITKIVSRPVYTFDNLLRHLTASVLLEPNNKFNIFASYNFRRRLELSTQERPGAVGFSFGVMMKIKRFSVQYSYSNYHLSSGSNHFAITTNFGEWYSKK
jgi:hypothetical protein